MKLVITGALGHIGSRLIHTLVPGEFDEVVLVDDLSTQRYCSLFNLPEGIRWTFVEADITDSHLDLATLFSEAIAVVHLAAITNAPASFENQEAVERVNYLGTQRVAEACVQSGSGLIFFSTTSVYGVSDGIVDESCPPDLLKPQSPYAESKLRAEVHLAEVGRTTGLRYVTFRFGTIYGASIGMRFHTAVNKFIWQACRGQPLTVWRTAMDQKRPYLDLGDAVEAIRFILRVKLFDKQIYNVVTDNATVRQITDEIREYIPDLNIEFVETRIMNQLSYTVSRDKLVLAGFRFQGELTHGIGDTVRLLRGHSTIRFGHSLR